MIHDHKLLKSNKNSKGYSSIKLLDYNSKPSCLPFNCCQRKTLDTTGQSEQISNVWDDLVAEFYESNHDDLFYHPNVYKYYTKQREIITRDRCSAQSPIPHCKPYIFKDKFIRITQL